jgi:peptidoglycan/LPS O-acetylase OafA/YrhL
MHFFRSIFSLLLLIAHKAMILNFNPLSHKLQMNEFILQPFNLIFRAAYLHTDIFIMFSGFLVAHSFIRRIKSGSKINFWSEVFSRYIRLMPPVAILMLFVTFILPLIGSGPLWNELVEYQAKLCKKTWWRNALMIQNLMGMEDICMFHVHHVATDFQLFLITPFIVIMLCSFTKLMIYGLVSMGLASTIARFAMTYYGNYSLFVTAGVR